MIITLTGDSRLDSDLQRLLFGITSYLIPKHDIRIVLGRRGGYEATYAAVERALLDGSEVSLEAYPSTTDKTSYIIEEFIQPDNIDWLDKPYSSVLESMVSTSFINRSRLGAHLCSVLGSTLEDPSDVVVYAGDINDNTNEYRCLKGAARREGITFLNLGDPSDIVHLFEMVELEEKPAYAICK